MYVIVLGIFVLKLQVSLSEPEFPTHLDLQKVGETIVNNEKYNILKTTSHVITDHFKEFMLRGTSKNPPGKKIFLDKNGFRHEWSGFGEKHKSLRKTDLKHKESDFFVNATKKAPESETILTDVIVNSTDSVEDTSNKNVSSKDSDENNQNEEKSNASYVNENGHNVTKENNETDGEETQEKNSSTETSVGKRLRQGGKAEKGKPDDKGKTDNKGKSDNEERTVIQTTFFCPYLGIITMSGFVDI